MIMLKYAIKIILMAVVMIVTLTGCVTVTLSGNGSYPGKEDLQGRGEMTTREFAITEFSSVKIDANVSIVYANAPSDVVKVEIQENLLEYLDVSVKNDRLFIDSDKNFITSENKTPTLYISTPKLNEIICDGLIKIKESAPIQSNDFHLQVNGSLDGDLEIHSNQLTVNIDGIGTINLTGKAPLTEVLSDGAATLNALKLETENSTVQIDGVGNVFLSCSDILNVRIDGMGSVYYRGTPTIHKQIDGMGSVNQVD